MRIKQEENPFRNYKQALKFLSITINSKTVLSEYKPTEIDWAIFTIVKSKKMRGGKK